jgi:hypothetical protein
MQPGSGIPSTCHQHGAAGWPPGTSAAFITCLTPELAEDLAHVAGEFLTRHQIRDEPPAWQPPAGLLNGLDLPGPDLAGTEPPATPSRALLLDHPAPADPAGGARRRRARYDISREQLRDLHHGQRLSFTEIGQRTGYSRTAIKDLARTYGMPTGA